MIFLSLAIAGTFAGIAAYLVRLARVLRDGRTAAPVPRLDTWWNLRAS